MKINFVKFYQDVLINKVVATSVSANKDRDSVFDKTNQAEISLEGTIGIKIKTGDNSVIVPFNNIAYYNIEEAIEKKGKVKIA